MIDTNISLDLTHYPGEDIYSDGDIEQRLLDLVSDHTREDYNRLIAEENNWAVLYHLSDLRNNIIRALPIRKSHSVLEIGAGLGAVTGAISDIAKKVTCIELSKRRSEINALRNKERKNITIKVGNFLDIYPTLTEKYNFITLIGVFEYANLYIKDTKTPYLDMLVRAKELLAKGGKIAIAIENKFGLKYWAGCREDHNGIIYSGLEGYQKGDGAQTFSKPELLSLFEKAGLRVSQFLYPYPDYKLPTVVYSDKQLPKVGELCTNNRNFDNDRVRSFNETAVWNEIIKNDNFPFFSNSFLAVVENNI